MVLYATLTTVDADFEDG